MADVSLDGRQFRPVENEAGSGTGDCASARTGLWDSRAGSGESVVEEIP